MLSEQAKAAKRAYQREWYARNKDKRAASMDAYWERKAASLEGGEPGEQQGEGQRGRKRIDGANKRTTQ